MNKLERTYRRLGLTEADLRSVSVTFRKIATGVIGEALHYFEYSKFLDEARMAIFGSAGYEGDFDENPEGWSLPVIGYTLKVLSPVRSGELVEVTGWCHRVEGVRGWMGFKVKNLSTGKDAACGYSEHCFTDCKTMKPIAPNPEWLIFRSLRLRVSQGGVS